MKKLMLVLLSLAAISLLAQEKAEPIDRQALVTRHNIECNALATTLPLGNGEFCFTADATGLQTFAGNALAHWAWHSFPQKSELFPVNLGRLRLCHGSGSAITKNEITAVKRTLDLWSGTQTAQFDIAGQPVRVATCVDPKNDAVAVRIESPLLALGVTLDFPYAWTKEDPWLGDWSQPERHTTHLTRPGKRVADFVRTLDATRYHVRLVWSAGAQLVAPTNAPNPKRVVQQALYGDQDTWSDVTAKVLAKIQEGKFYLTPGYDWLGDPLPGRAKQLKLTIVTDGREETVAVADGELFSLAPHASPHAFQLTSAGTNRLDFVCAFAAMPVTAEFPDGDKVFDASAQAWKSFWSTGGAIDLSGSRDPRWRELERRVVLSQYHTATQSSGSWPPAESGLFGSTAWGGRFHMEMVWWHLAHFALWDRWDRATNALGCYQRFTPTARALAEQGGYPGLEWPKCVGPEGRSSPWVGNHVLLWKQPHPIFFAELDYRRNPARATLDKWRDVVFGTAEYMAAYPTRDAATGLYSLAPVMPPSEQGITRDTVFDLAYWRWGLDKAQAWRERLGLKREPRWDEVRKNLAPLPVVDGLFVHSAEWHDTYTKRNFEHPDPIGVFGMLPPLEGVDAATAHRTVLKVWETWNWDRCWGWDFPWIAMAAARTGHPQIAVDALLAKSPRNDYDLRGINTGGPCPYLPGNGGLLYAVAMMAAGWDPPTPGGFDLCQGSGGQVGVTSGAPQRDAPGFPDDGSWVVKWEGLKKAP